jgi:hypothetical protein
VSERGFICETAVPSNMSAEKDDPLEELVVDRQRVNKRRVVDALDEVLNVDNEGNLVRSSRFSQLDSRRKLVAVLLARWVAAELDLVENPAVEMDELSEQVGLSGSGLRRYIDDLEFVQPDSIDSAYLIPDVRVVDAVEYLEDEEELRARRQSGT